MWCRNFRIPRLRISRQGPSPPDRSRRAQRDGSAARAHRHQAAAKHAVAVHCFHGVVRTGGHVPASRRQERRKRRFVSAQQGEHEVSGALVHGFTAAFSITSNARRISRCTSANAAVRSDFLGLITTSMAAGIMPCNRTASRRRRLHAIAYHCAAQHLAHRESHAHALGFLLIRRTRQIKHSQVRGKMPASLFVHSLEIRVPEQTYAAGEFAALGRGRTGRRCHSPRVGSKHASTQVASLPRFPERKKHYSRKPGFTDTRLRPLARRREITARPALVFIRVRNPCVFER